MGWKLKNSLKKLVTGNIVIKEHFFTNSGCDAAQEHMEKKQSSGSALHPH
jgi:hypothetical protein